MSLEQFFVHNTRDEQIDDLVQDCSISIANVLEILQSYTKPSKLFYPTVFCVA